MALLLRADGTTTTLDIPASMPNADRLKLFQDTVGGWIEVIPIGTNKMMVLDEEGKLKAKPHNGTATMIAARTIRGDDFIVGDVILVTHAEFERDEEGEEA